jgi:hypothetical protein
MGKQIGNNGKTPSFGPGFESLMAYCFIGGIRVNQGTVKFLFHST